MQEENIKAFNLKTLQEVKKSLVKNGFKCEIFDDLATTKQYIINLIGKNKTVGIGGSQTINMLDIIDDLKNNNNKIITHSPEMDKDTKMEIWKQAQYSDFYLASPQSITLNGEVVFLDAYGNRVSSCIIGPKKVILICGINKITNDLNTAIWRTRNVAAVINNIRLKKPNPCVTTNTCQDCNSSTRICNVLVVLYKKPNYTDYEIILTNFSLGY
ncbi:MAG: lactate utilization protein [Endomicrobia bacterium]|nr:lactate utilization protein [Endomicrobiia bacterium]